MDCEELGGVGRGTSRSPGEGHVGFFGGSSAFAVVAGATRGGEVFPGVRAASVPGGDVIEGEVAAASAVLAAVAIASEDFTSGESELGHGAPDEVLEADDGGRVEAGGADTTQRLVPGLEDFRFPPEHEHDGPFDRADIEGLVVLVQHQRPPLDRHFTSVGLDRIAAPGRRGSGRFRGKCSGIRTRS